MASDASQSAPQQLNKDGTPRKKNGRHKKHADIDRLKAFMASYPTEENTCLFFETSSKTLFRQIKKETGLTFVQFREKYMIHTRHTLIQKALHRATQQNSDRMLELCLKNINGWNGTNDAPSTHAPIQLMYSLDVPPEHPVPPRDVTPEKEPESA